MALTKVKLISDGVIIVDNLAENHGITTTHISEGDNLYYTDARVGSYLSANGYITASGGYFYNATLSANILTFDKSDGTTDSVDLSLYLDDTNLARLVSGTLDALTGIATFTRDDSSTFTVDFSSLLGGSNDYVSSGSFDTSTGILTLTRDGGGTVTVNLDNRYLTSFTETDPVYTASSWYNTTNNAGNWDTAYGWGNHSGLYLPIGGKAADSDLLDGSNGTYFDHRRYTDSSNYLGGYYVGGGTEKPNNTVFGAGKFKVAMLSGSNLGFGGSWNDVMWISTYSGADVKSSHALVFDKYSSNVWVSDQNYDSASWGTGYLLITSANIGSQSVSNADTVDGLHASSFAPAGGSAATDWYCDDLFYDQWIRNNSTSASGLYWHNASNPGYDWHIYPQSRADMTFRTGAGNGGIKGTIENETARGYIHWTTSNEIGFLNSSRGWSLRVDNSGNTFATASHRAPIFYDNNNTGYYVDPASTSNINQIFGDTASFGRLGINNSSDTTRYGLSLYGGYSTGEPTYGILFTGTSLGSHGLVTGSWATYFTMSASTNRGWIFRVAGSSNVASINNTGNAQFDGSVRTPIFYDSNNTGYYVDPSSASYLNVVGAAGRIYTGYDSGQSGSVSCSNWFRSNGATGWYNASYGGGINMADTTWVRVYNSKAFYVANQIAATGDVTAYYSDERLKERKGNIADPIQKVLSLNGFYYTNNDLAKENGYIENKLQVGLSAQEVQAIMPETVSLAPFDMETLEDGKIVSKSGENYLTVNYAKLVPLLVEAIKEQQKQIEELKKLIN